MTEAELFSVWERFMHRNDLSADLDTVYVIAKERVNERLLQDADITEILADRPRVLIHAGLVYLNELAQDDEGINREQGFFEDALRDLSIALSISRNWTINPYSYQGTS